MTNAPKDSLSTKTADEANGANESAESQANQAELDSVAQNVICAETINIFCKSTEIDLNAELNETFQYNRFGTRNGYIFVSFRLYYDFKSDEQIEQYKSKERATLAAAQHSIATTIQSHLPHPGRTSTSSASTFASNTGSSGAAAAAARRFRKAIKGLNAKLRPTTGATTSATTPLTPE